MKSTDPNKVRSNVIHWAPVICLPLLFATTSCTKDTSAVADEITNDSNGTPNYDLQAIGSHQMVLLPKTDAADSIIILDWVDMPTPVVNVPKVVAHYQMENNGQDLILIGSGKPIARFSTRDNPQSTRGELVYHVNGISKLTDRGGFDAGALTTSSASDAFDAANSVRLGRAQGSEKIGGDGGGKTHPEALCYSGGPGATSCSTHGTGGYGCSVSCGSGYYACCDMDGLECKCVKE